MKPQGSTSSGGWLVAANKVFWLKELPQIPCRGRNCQLGVDEVEEEERGGEGNEGGGKRRRRQRRRRRGEEKTKKEEKSEEKSGGNIKLFWLQDHRFPCRGKLPG